MKKGATGYGFNLHSEKSKPGQYIRAVDEESPADKAGLKPQDKIVQVRISLLYKQRLCTGRFYKANYSAAHP